MNDDLLQPVAMSKYIITCINPTEPAVFKRELPYPDKSLIRIGAGPDVAG